MLQLLPTMQLEAGVQSLLMLLQPKLQLEARIQRGQGWGHRWVLGRVQDPGRVLPR